MKQFLYVLIGLCMLLFLARAVPSGMISEEAQERYVEESGSDEYDFL